MSQIRIVVFPLFFLCSLFNKNIKLTTEGFAFAKTRNNPAISEFEIHIFVPFITYSVPSFFASVFKEKASDPEPGSVRQKLPA